MVIALVLTFFGRARLGLQLKQIFTTFQTVDPEICFVSIFFKESGTSSSITIRG